MYKPSFATVRAFASSLCAAALLIACGGGSGDAGQAASGASTPTPSIATGTMSMQLNNATVPSGDLQVALPTFHALPVLLSEPGNQDVQRNAVSATQSPHRISIPTDAAKLSTQRLTVQDIHARRSHHDSATGTNATDRVAPSVTAASAVYYTPAQIRAAYQLPTLPALGTVPTAEQAAQMGAGQTIYIIDAMHDPNAAAELAAFNTKYGLPACTTQAIPVTSKLPLAPAPTTDPSCTLSVVYSTPSATMTSSEPAYDAGWATEIALDIQWAHATAPLARIILIEAPDPSFNSMLNAVNLANAMGPGIVSMSWGDREAGWNASVDFVFTGANMTYLAAAGDSGAEVQFPAVSSNVVAVGGTSLTYSGTGTRSETVWSGTGGGISRFMPTPSYQTAAVPGLGKVAHRSVTDVSFNADPYTGQVVAVIPKDEKVPSWMILGGTSVSAPQWAGVLASANAQRAANSKPALGAPHTFLYTQVATTPDTYASTFGDITTGSNGFAARPGYDQPTGLGTPNGTALLGFLSGAVPAPVVTPASITGTTGTPLSFTVSVTASNPVTYALSGAPSGMSIDANGNVNWPTPVVGNYFVTVTATDTQTKLSGSGLYTVTISVPVPPVVYGSPVVAIATKPLLFNLMYTAPILDPLTFSLSGAPSGMSVDAMGLVTWANPAVGNYTMTATVKDTKTGLSGSGVYNIYVFAAPSPPTSGPSITFDEMTGVAGQPMTGTISIADPGMAWVQVSLSGIPMGMKFSANGMSLIVRWAKPVAGQYKLKVSATDSGGRTAQATVPITVLAPK